MVLRTRYHHDRLDDRQVTELIGIARGLIADGFLNDEEIGFLHKWLAATEGVSDNPLISTLMARIDAVLADGIIDPDERAEIFEAMKALTGADFVTGEALKSTTLPLCDPAPDIVFPEQRFCLTGSFVFGARKDCELAVRQRGGLPGSVRMDTAFLVIGEYASDDWIQSSYGRKIEKAVEYRDRRGLPIHIVSEAHWQSFL